MQKLEKIDKAFNNCIGHLIGDIENHTDKVVIITIKHNINILREIIKNIHKDS